jgi:hypothetical protein
MRQKNGVVDARDDVRSKKYGVVDALLDDVRSIIVLSVTGY